MTSGTRTPRPPLLNAALRWFLLAMILANIAGEMFYSLLALYMAELGTQVTDIGLVFSLSSIVMLILQLFGGWLSDTIGRLKAVAIGSAVAMMGYFLMPFASSWGWVLLALCLEYVSGALIAPTYGAFIAEQSSEETRARVFSLSGGIFMIVSVIGPPLAGYLVSHFSFRSMLIVSALIYTAASLLRIWMALNAHRWSPVGAVQAAAAPGKVNLKQFWTHLGGMVGLVTAGGLLVWILITDGVRDVAYRLSGDLMPLYFKQMGGLDVQQVGWIWSMFGVAMMITTFPSGWISDHFGERSVISAGFLLQTVGFALFLAGRDFWAFAASVLIFGCGVGISSPAYDSLVSKAVPEKFRGIAFGLFRSSIGVISLAAPWAGAQLWARFIPQLPFAITTGLLLLAIIPAWFKLRLPDKKPVQGENQA